MKPDPKVSIIIPVYNGSNYLREAIDSTLAQTYKNMEVIVVNDGSNDGGKTESIAKSYGDRIRYFSKENGGVSSALNFGIKVMTGEWFAWLSHDDLYLPNKLEEQINFLSEHPEAKVVACNMEIIDDSGKVLYTRINSLHPTIKTGRQVLEVWVYACSLLIHKTCFDTVGLFNTAYRTTQDLEMCLRLAYHYPIIYQPDVLCQHRKHSESDSVTRADRMSRETYEVYKWMLEEFGISWFFPINSAGATDPVVPTRRLRSKTYGWLRDSALRRDSIQTAELCNEYAFKAWPSPMNPALYKYVIGINNLQFLKAYKDKLRQNIGSIIKRFIPGLFMFYKSVKQKLS